MAQVYRASDILAGNVQPVGEIPGPPKTAEQMTLGEMIDALEKCDPATIVYFDFCDFSPYGIDSYRGTYAHLALGYRPAFRQSGNALNVVETLVLLRAALGRTFTGYKGGEFKMNRDTPMWVSDYGQSASTGIVGVTNYGYMVIINTKHLDLTSRS